MNFDRGVFLFSGLVAVCGLALTCTVQAMQTDATYPLTAVNDTQTPPNNALQDVPMGQSSSGQASLLPEDAAGSKVDNVFGRQGGYFHPYITIQEALTDNVYNIKTDRVSSWVTTVSPGMWFALPRKKEIPVAITPHNTSPGGLQYQFKDHEGTDRVQAYLLGGLDFINYSGNSNLNTTNGDLEGLLRYNMPSGLSLQIVDRYTLGENAPEYKNQAATENYKSNFSLATIDWKMTEKLRSKLEYSNFLLNYDKTQYTFQNRVDNGFDFYQYYVYSEKTSFFIEDKYLVLRYDETTGSANNNSQNFIYGGIKWDTTEKLSLMAKVGQQKRNFDNNGGGVRTDYNGLAADLQAVYRPTIKTRLDFDLYRTNEETDDLTASDKTVVGATFGYRQKFNDKVSGSCDVTYENAEYRELIPQQRTDNRIFIRPAVQYLFREWLMGEIAYEYDKRDSTNDLYGYYSNTILFNLKFAL
ncbi:MAG: outer membrane beta-barrel protein [Desulfocapsaceae bacterium]|nr:outer membrane beta-barrel protein [Desulfocapsaceae bacterium]